MKFQFQINDLPQENLKFYNQHFCKNSIMARVMAFDYGQKRVGVAATDPLQIIANAVDTVETKEIFIFIKNFNFLFD